MDNEEKVLRSYIRKAISIVKERRSEKKNLEEEKLRKIVRNLILQEAELKKHRTTGKNKLEWFLSKSGFKERVMEAYVSLTTSEKQRESFRKHILWHVEDTMFKSDPSFIMQAGNLEYGRQGKYDEQLASEEDFAEEGSVDVATSPAALQEVVVDVDVEEDERLMGKEEDSPETEKEKKLKTFGLPGLDRTGLIDAFDIWDKGLDTLLLDTWNRLVSAAVGTVPGEELSAADLDKLLFYKLLIRQLGYHFETWEREAMARQRSRETATRMEEPIEEPAIELAPEVPEEEEGF